MLVKPHNMPAGEAAVTTPDSGRRPWSLRLASFYGRQRKALLTKAELFAYDVSGLPMALHASSGEAHPDAAVLHCFYRRYFWQQPLTWLRGLLAMLIWPLALAFTVVQNTWRSGPMIRTRTGKSIARQMGEQIKHATVHAIAPPWYYLFELFDEGRAAKAPQYLTAHETIAGAYDALEPPPGTDRLADKVWFAEHCDARRIRAVPVLFHASNGEIILNSAHQHLEREIDLFVKPRTGNGGHRAERWDRAGPGLFRNSRGETLGWSALLSRLAEASLAEDVIVQPRLINHPSLADISNDALATARILTCKTEDGGFEAVNAAFRMAIGSNAVVDNFHQGGLAAPVDLATGRIGAASDMGRTPHIGWREVHPVSKAVFAGRVLPFWKEAVALSCAAHATFSERIAIGWDVAFLADGPMIVEGNGKPDLDIHQRAERRPLGDQRIAALLAHHVAKLDALKR